MGTLIHLRHFRVNRNCSSSHGPPARENFSPIRANTQSTGARSSGAFLGQLSTFETFLRPGLYELQQARTRDIRSPGSSRQLRHSSFGSAPQAARSLVLAFRGRSDVGSRRAWPAQMTAVI